MAGPEKKKRPAPPPMAPRDATDAVPGGVQQSLADDLRTTTDLTDPFRKGSVAEHRERMGEAPGRPSSGRVPPHPVPADRVPAAHDMLYPRDVYEHVPGGGYRRIPNTGPVESVPDSELDIDPNDDIEADRQAAAMHAEAEKRNADIRSRRPRAPGARD